MGVGRKPLPTHLKVLKGTDQPCRINPEEPKPAADKVEKPGGMTPEAAAHWDDMAPLMQEAGLLTNVDVPAFATYCEAWAEWRRATNDLNRVGALVRTPNGYPILNPLHSVVKNAFERQHKLLAEFGMTPSSRTRVKGQPKDGGKVDPWDAI